MPASCAASMIAWLSGSSVSEPKFMVPRQSRETVSPDRPRWVYSIPPPCARAPARCLIAEPPSTPRRAAQHADGVLDSLGCLVIHLASSERKDSHDDAHRTATTAPYRSHRRCP